MPAARAGAPSLADRIADDLRRRIARGELRAGEPLRQGQLAAQLGVSPIPVREALQQLDAEGLVCFRPYRGAVVAPLDLAELSELSEILALLEPLALRAALPHLTPGMIERAERIDRSRRAARDLARRAELHFQLHAALFAAAERPHLLAVIRALHARRSRYASLELSQPLRNGADPTHRALLDACARGAEGAACAALLAEIEGGVAGLRTLLREASEEALPAAVAWPEPPAALPAGCEFRLPEEETPARRLARRLRDAIGRGELQAGQALPQVELAAQLGVSVIPLREALRILEVGGVVSRGSARGLAVTASLPLEARDLVETALAVESLALRLAFPHLDGTALAEARSLAREHERNRNPARAADLNFRFHAALYAPARRPLLLGLIRGFHDQAYLFSYAFMTRRSEDLQRIHPIHHRLVEACAAADLPGALDALAEDMAQCAETIASLLEEDRAGPH